MTTPISQPMQLDDDYVPGILDGVYMLSAQHSVLPPNEAEALNYFRGHQFTVKGPRFHLPATDFHSMTPPAGATGEFGHSLPQLTLTKRALPWERELVTGEASKESEDATYLPTPWLALLVFSEDEYQHVHAQSLTLGGADGMGGSDTWMERTGQPAPSFQTLASDGTTTVLLPELGYQDDDLSALVRTLDLPAELFQQLCPKIDLANGIDEARLLAHVRKVSMDDKPPLKRSMPGDGEFSVLIANRFPTRGAVHVHLVSLEGWYSLLSPDPASVANTAIKVPQRTSAPGDLVRVVSLHEWSFVNTPGSVSFGHLLRDLSRDVLRFPTAVLDQAVLKTNANLESKLNDGYLPVDYQPRGADRTFAWYRGPLSPVPVDPLADGAAFDHADAALITDSATGTVDISYATAWQLGRMLALSSSTFGDELLELREKYTKDQWVADKLSRLIDADPTTHPFLDQADGVMDWLAKLALLESVPFTHMVADDRLLPQESLRFFHIDGNWIEALIDGALSIAVHCSLDREATRSPPARNALDAAVSKFVREYRAKKLGRASLPQSAASFLSQPRTGFLLRSQVVHGWPGLEITVSGTPAPGQTSLNIVRWEHLEAGTLFCLVEGTVTGVTFSEPQESLSLGVDDNDGLMVRHLSDAGGATIGAPTDYTEAAADMVPTYFEAAGSLNDTSTNRFPEEPLTLTDNTVSLALGTVAISPASRAVAKESGVIPTVALQSIKVNPVATGAVPVDLVGASSRLALDPDLPNQTEMAAANHPEKKLFRVKRHLAQPSAVQLDLLAHALTEVAGQLAKLGAENSLRVFTSRFRRLGQTLEAATPCAGLDLMPLVNLNRLLVSYLEQADRALEEAVMANYGDSNPSSTFRADEQEYLLTAAQLGQVLAAFFTSLLANAEPPAVAAIATFLSAESADLQVAADAVSALGSVLSTQATEIQAATPGPEGVLDVHALATGLATVAPITQNAGSPAPIYPPSALALHLMRSPEMVTIKWNPS